ncbi:hypothetical protein GCM10011379_23970 [Filimonas zeae]|uniref:Uncharacterized protein n=1 Tax=Filimonas zeae TaxID=1737353 RepID=A0A917J0X9_9BACT|nr:hypothetical protein GCM10011379_23970 [Filimonas zeae]
MFKNSRFTIVVENKKGLPRGKPLNVFMWVCTKHQRPTLRVSNDDGDEYAFVCSWTQK